MKKKRRFFYIHFTIAVVLSAFVAAAISFYVRQNRQMNKRIAEQEELRRQEEEIALERNRLQLLSQYIGTKDYAEYYARYKLGYTYPDEIVFER